MDISFFIGGLSGGGAERVVCNNANYLVELGNNVTILTMSDDEPTYPLSSEIKRYALILKNERKGFIYNAFKRLFRLAKYIRSNRPDIYVVMLPLTTIMLLLLKCFTDSPIIAAERNNPASYTKSIQKLLRLTASKANGWVFQTEEARNWYGKATGKAKVQIIPNAINPDFIIEPYRGEREKTIVTAGRLTAQKNHKLLIQAFAKITPHFPDFQLVILGDGPLKEQLKTIAVEQGIEGKVLLTGYTSNIGEKIKDASLFVLSSDFEGMPNALMEAMALGLPCVSTDCKGGGARFLIDDRKNGLLTPTGDVEALAKAMERMLSDREFAYRCGVEAHKICERLAPEKIYGEWKRFIEEIVKKKW